jgi:hypothetical protein
MIIDVTGVAVCDCVYILDDLVLDLQMTLVAFDFILINMLCMHEVCILVFVESLSLPMALVTILAGNLPIAQNGIVVAFVT